MKLSINTDSKTVTIQEMKCTEIKKIKSMLEGMGEKFEDYSIMTEPQIYWYYPYGYQQQQLYYSEMPSILESKQNLYTWEDGKSYYGFNT